MARPILMGCLVFAGGQEMKIFVTAFQDLRKKYGR